MRALGLGLGSLIPVLENVDDAPDMEARMRGIEARLRRLEDDVAALSRGPHGGYRLAAGELLTARTRLGREARELGISLERYEIEFGFDYELAESRVMKPLPDAAMSVKAKRELGDAGQDVAGTEDQTSTDEGHIA